ncbi:MAG: hypothetical protein K5787_08335 [Lentisphaeria bacterium]|nr:hypothetical protein [Lentisphaeria bacterium]
MKKWYLTGLGITLSNGDDLRKDTFAKRLFRCPDIVAWLVKTCVQEFQEMEPSEIIGGWLSKANLRIGTEPVGQDVIRPSVPAIGTEDKSVTDGTVYYDFRTELALPGAPPKAPLLILDMEMQKDYENWLVIHKRVIYYPCRLVSRQPGELMDGREDYARLCRVCSIWILPVVPSHMANRVLRICQRVEDMSDGHAKPAGPMPDALMESWMLCLRDGCPPKRGRNGLWLMYVLLTKTMPSAQKMEILEMDFGIKTTKELKEMFTYDDYLKAEYRKEGEAQGIKKGEAQGIKKGEAKGRNEMMLQTYTNMKNKNYKDGDICSLLGISLYKLRQIKKLAQEATTL